MRNYTQKTVYIGIDVHKKSYTVVTICDGEVVKKDRLLAYPEGLVKYIKKHFKGAKRIETVYEAGFSGFHLHRHLLSQGINNIVVHPASIKISSRDRVKTDKRDALKMAKQLSTGDLKGIKVPREGREFFRALTRARDQIVEARKRVGNQLKSLLYTQGMIDPADDRRISYAWIKEVQKAEVPEDLKICIDAYAKLWLNLTTQLKEILIKLEEQAKNDISLDAIYRSVPGIGALSARILANELEDMQHFNNEKGLFSYTGLTPSEKSSGEHKWQGSISRQGRPILRKILVQVAWRNIKLDKRMYQIFMRISKHKGRRRAIVAVARKIIGCVRACFSNGELWHANAPESKAPLSVTVEAC